MTTATATAGAATATETKTQDTANPTTEGGKPATAAPAAGETKDPPKEESKGSMVSDPPKADEKKPEVAKPAVPEKYELKLPEGSNADASYLEKVASLAKEKGWTNERAQEYVDDRHAAIVEHAETQKQELLNLNGKTWMEELQKDPDVGGAKFKESGELAYEGAVRAFGKEFADELKAMNLNHHPRLFKGLVKLGREMQPDQLVKGTQTQGAKKEEEVWYPKKGS